jgi:hypothetical protein
MAYRLVGKINERAVTMALSNGTLVVGSAPECVVCIEHPSVSRRHAELDISNNTIRIKDLRSLNGTFVGQERIQESEVKPGDELGFGRVSLRLESVPEKDTEAALILPDKSRSSDAAPTPAFVVLHSEKDSSGSGNGSREGTVESISPSTLGTRAIDAFTTERLPELLRTLAEGADLTRVASRGGDALFQMLPALSIQISSRTESGSGTLFEAFREGDEHPSGAEIVAQAGDVAVRITFPARTMVEFYRPLVQNVALLVHLADTRRPALAPSSRVGPPPLPEPASVVPEAKQIYADAARVAKGDVGVLIQGESGTGKEVLARYIHQASSRASTQFVALNCAALPRDLLEAELFGIERGVATGVDQRPGKFELADGGTLFLDEIGDMSPDTQARILRVLQEQEVFRLGGTTARKARVRIVAATNRDLTQLIQKGQFREDLYYRIATWVVELPPLRRRRADIPNLAAHFLAREANRNGLVVRGISRGALEVLVGAPWPGNIRQLENEISRAVLFLRGSELMEARCLSPQLRSAPPVGTTLKETLEQVERVEIRKALDSLNNDVPRAAELLGIARSTFYRRLRELDIDLGTNAGSGTGAGLNNAEPEPKS